MLIQNISSSPVTLAGIYVIAAGQSLTIPYAALEDSRTFLQQVDAQNLRVLQAEESFTLASMPRFTQGQLFPAQTLAAGEAYTPTLNNGTTPILLWLAPFQNSRLYLYVSSGDIELSFLDSPDGGATFFSAPDAPSMQATATTSGGVTTAGTVSALLPRGLCLLQVTLHSTNGGTGYVSYSRQT